MKLEIITLSETNRQRQISHVLSQMQNIDLKQERHKCETETVDRRKIRGRKLKDRVMGVNKIEVFYLHVWKWSNETH
jgi:hypothetical protein